jgi:osmotically-inducible protein OsmY
LVTDAEVAERVRDALKRDPFVDRHEIVVGVMNGRVYLSGEVNDYFEKARADDIASRVRGVVSVDNNISVLDENHFFGYDPHIDDGSLYDYDWYHWPPVVEPFHDDRVIEDRIKEELLWSPYVDSDEVDVSVEDGRATLTGTVGTWLERRMARKNAYEGGAAAVNSELDIE